MHVAHLAKMINANKVSAYNLNGRDHLEHICHIKKHKNEYNWNSVKLSSGFV
jgi:hypothetical protein